MSEHHSFLLALTVCFISLVGSVVYYNVAKDQFIKSNVDSAVAKGIDPVSVRCAYASSEDRICLAYAVSVGKPTK